MWYTKYMKKPYEITHAETQEAKELLKKNTLDLKTYRRVQAVALKVQYVVPV